MDSKCACNNCLKRNVCKYIEDYRHDCEIVSSYTVCDITELQIRCNEYIQQKATEKEKIPPVRFA